MRKQASTVLRSGIDVHMLFSDVVMPGPRCAALKWPHR
jgi:hypothetical protein